MAEIISFAAAQEQKEEKRVLNEMKRFFTEYFLLNATIEEKQALKQAFGRNAN